MVSKANLFLVLLVFLIFTVGCKTTKESGIGTTQVVGLVPSATLTALPTSTQVNPTATEPPASTEAVITRPTDTSTPTTSPTSTINPTPTVSVGVFEFGEELTIQYLQNLEISGSEIVFDEKLADRSNYHQHLVSYISEGNKIYGLLTIPFAEPPEGGYKAIVFNHGYIPSAAYRTTERYTAYVDYLARSGFVVLKIDYRGHGISEGEPTGSYFSPGYTIDAIAALKSLQMLDIIDPQGIGMWGHSMAGKPSVVSAKSLDRVFGWAPDI